MSTETKQPAWCAGSGAAVAVAIQKGLSFRGVVCPVCGAQRVAKIVGGASSGEMPEHRPDVAAAASSAPATVEPVLRQVEPGPSASSPVTSRVSRKARKPRAAEPAAAPLEGEIMPEASTALAVVPSASADLGRLMPEVERAQSYAAASKAPRTSALYEAEWSAFGRWAGERGLSAAVPVDARVVATYLGALADKGRKAAGIELALVAISQVHKDAGLESPRRTGVVAKVRAGIRRTIGTAQESRAPLMVDALRQVVGAIASDGPRDRRDRALLLLGFAGAFRRSELAALDVTDIELRPEGALVTLRRSKTDQEGKGRRVAVRPGTRAETCPIAALRAWLDVRGNEGPLFVSVDRFGRQRHRLRGADVALVVKARARAAGLDVSRLSGHSLRSGLATSAAAAGKSERSIMATTGHVSVTMARRYIKNADYFKDVAGEGIGL